MICRVAPGLADTRASVRRPVSALTRLDLPTLERPAKAISGSAMAGSDSNDAAPATNSQVPAKSLRAASISPGVRPSGFLVVHQPFLDVPLPPFFPPPPPPPSAAAGAGSTATACLALAPRSVPWRRMIVYCWAIDSVLLHAQ